MEFDIVNIVTSIGIPGAICFFLLWKLIPTVNGLKTVINDLVVAVTVQTETVKEDSTNTREMRQEMSNLRAEIQKMNGNKHE